MDWQPNAAVLGQSRQNRRNSSPKGDSHWQVGTNERADSKNDNDAGTKQRRKSSSPKHALDHLEAAHDKHAAEQHGVNSKEFSDKMAKAEKALLYRLRFEGEYMRKKKREYDKYAKKEAEAREMEEAKAAAEERIKLERERARETLQQRKMLRENAKVERSLSTGLAAFRRVKLAQRDAKRYSDRHVLLSEQYSHLNYLLERKKEEKAKLEAAARTRFLREQEGKIRGHETSNGKKGDASTHRNHHHKKHAKSIGKKKSQIALRSAMQSGDSVPYMTIAQRTREVEKYQHVVEHRLRNLGDLTLEVNREREEINRLRRSYRSKQKDLESATRKRDQTEVSLEETRAKYDTQVDSVHALEKDIAILRKNISDDQEQFSEMWDNQMEQLTSFHREATRKVDEMGGQSSKKAKSMFSRKISHLPSDRHSRLLGLDNSKSLSRNHQTVLRREKKLIKTMDEAFQAITRATGIDSLEELVDTFVHADRRNYSVVKHITALERDVDELVAEVRDLKDRRKRLELEQQRSGMSRRQKVTSMARELESLKRQNEVLVSAHERDMRVISEIGPEVHELFVQLGCQDPHVPKEYTKALMTDRNLMRMLGLVDQQTALVMSVFGQLAEENEGNSISPNVRYNIALSKTMPLSYGNKTLSSKPAPPSIGDFDEEDDDLDRENEESDSSSSSSSSSSDSEDETDRDVSKHSRASGKRNKRNKKSSPSRKRNGHRSSSGHSLVAAAGSKSAIQKPESISHLRKHIQRKVESGNHRHHHGSVIRFKPSTTTHFNKRETFIVKPSGASAASDGTSGASTPGAMPTGLGINVDQLAALQAQHGNPNKS